MVARSELKRVDECEWEIPREHRADMRVPARIFADEALLEAALGDKSVEQLINTACLPGVVKYTLAMPDIHQGYGPPIGGVAAMSLHDGVLSPGAVGYDINCGVRLLRSSLSADQVRPMMAEIMDALYSRVPSGVGRGGDVTVSKKEMDDVLEGGSSWAVAKGYGTKDDLQNTEENGQMPTARAGAVSRRAKERGADQLGTLGAGNHFVELGEVKQILDPVAAEAFGLFPGQLVVWVHSGSRGLGHQVCDDYVQSLQSAVQKYGIKLPDRELVCAPFNSEEGEQYMAAMSCAANFAWANRQLLMVRVQRILKELLAARLGRFDLALVYDVAHNIAKVERHVVDGKPMRVIVHRKGATRSLGPNHPDVPEAYRPVGQPVLVPGDMGTGSFVLVGTAAAAEKSFSSSCHGAGRVMSRHAVKRQVRGEDVQRSLELKGITVRGPWKGLAEEAPDAYKDIDSVVDVVDRAGLARKVARLVPLGVIKG
jgi:tRNA-splicing ligase RtcB